MTFAEKVISFNNQLKFDGILPADIQIMNPFYNNEVKRISQAFYQKYYDDDKPRHLILGINPGRFGAGVTGIPFTDPQRLKRICNISCDSNEYEPSSDYIYRMIEAYGGAEQFYGKFYINSVCPLGFVRVKDGGKAVNYNYYDSKELTNAVYNFIIENIKKQIALGVVTDACFCFGTGDNLQFLNKLNKEHQFFGKVIPLEHPRYIMQYKSKSSQDFINKYLTAFAGV